MNTETKMDCLSCGVFGVNSKEMEQNTDRVCRFCLKTSHDFVILDESHHEILTVLLLQVDLAISHEPVTCKSCADKLQKCFKFKTASLHVKEHLGFDNSVGVNTCLFCKKLMLFDSFVLLYTDQLDIMLFKAMMEQFLPESNLHDITHPVVCLMCYELLQQNFKFLVSCLNKEQQIKKFCKEVGTNNKGQIELENVVRFMTENAINSSSTETGETSCRSEKDTNNISDIWCDDTNKEKEVGANKKVEIELENVCFTAEKVLKSSSTKTGETSCISKKDTNDISDILYDDINKEKEVGANKKVQIELENVGFMAEKVLNNSCTKTGESSCKRKRDTNTISDIWHDDIIKEKEVGPNKKVFTAEKVLNKDTNNVSDICHDDSNKEENETRDVPEFIMLDRIWDECGITNQETVNNVNPSLSPKCIKDEIDSNTMNEEIKIEETWLREENGTNTVVDVKHESIDALVKMYMDYKQETTSESNESEKGHSDKMDRKIGEDVESKGSDKELEDGADGIKEEKEDDKCNEWWTTIAISSIKGSKTKSSSLNPL